jgi:hypothetical protein
MSENDTTTDEIERDECPESFCIQAFRPQEMIVHLRWDHGYSEYRARRRVHATHSVYTDSDG